MDNAPYMSSVAYAHSALIEYLNRKAQLAKMSKTERLVEPFNINSYYGAMCSPKPTVIIGLESNISDIDEKLQKADIQWMQNLKASESFTVNDLTCPHAKAMLFTKAKTKKGN